MGKEVSKWSKEVIGKLNAHQSGYYKQTLSDGSVIDWPVHPYTCCSKTSAGEICKRSEHDDGVLIATENGWICPCGKYTQNWAHGVPKIKKEKKWKFMSFIKEMFMKAAVVLKSI